MRVKKVLGSVLATLLVVPATAVAVAGPAQAACYSAKTSTSLVSADASVSYGSCKQGTTRSYAKVGGAVGDSGWYKGSTSAWARGLGSSEAKAQVSNVR